MSPFLARHADRRFGAHALMARSARRRSPIVSSVRDRDPIERPVPPSELHATAFDAALAAHRGALDDFVDAAARVDPSAWNTSSDPEKWTPAQVVEHVRLSYVMVCDELEGRGGFRVRTSWWRQRLLQWTALRRILRSGRMPAGVPAVREIRPAGGPFVKAELLEALRADGERFLHLVSTLGAGSRVTMSHPFLGHLHVLEGMNLSTHHMRHHQTQLQEPDKG